MDVKDRDTIRVVEAAPRAGYRIWLRYSDGVAGEVDLSDLAGRGVFDAWLDRSFFERVHVSPYGSVAWSDDVELCEDALYLRLTGKSVEEVMPATRRLAAGAAGTLRDVMREISQNAQRRGLTPEILQAILDEE